MGEGLNPNYNEEEIGEICKDCDLPEPVFYGSWQIGDMIDGVQNMSFVVLICNDKTSEHHLLEWICIGETYVG